MNTVAKEIKFTKRQLEVLNLWSQLPSEVAIGKTLKISHHSVHTHLRRMREKSGKKRTFDVWKYAVKAGLLAVT